MKLLGDMTRVCIRISRISQLGRLRGPWISNFAQSRISDLKVAKNFWRRVERSLELNKLYLFFRNFAFWKVLTFPNPLIFSKIIKFHHLVAIESTFQNYVIEKENFWLLIKSEVLSILRISRSFWIFVRMRLFQLRISWQFWNFCSNSFSKKLSGELWVKVWVR